MSGRPPLTDDFLREVAHIYRDNVAKRRPVQAVAEHFDAPYQTASKWAIKARRRGFLPATANGRMSGQPEAAPKRAIRVAALNEAADVAEMVAIGFLDNAETEQGNGAMAVAAELRERAAALAPITTGA